MKKRAVLYPINEEQIPIFLYHNLFNEKYEIVSAVAQPYVGKGKDISYLDNRENMGIAIKQDLKQELNLAEALFVPYMGESFLDQKMRLIETMKMAAQMGRDVICNVEISEEERKVIQGLCELNQCLFVSGLDSERSWMNRSARNLQQVPVPVIWVGQADYPANGTEIVMKMAGRLKKDGYRVAVLGMRPEYNLMGFHYNFILAKLLQGDITGGDLSNVIFLLNLWANDIVIKEKTDVLLIEVPGASVESPYYINDCGVYSYIVSRAVEPDYAIGTTAFPKADMKDYEEINGIIENRYDFRFNCFHISNRMINAEEILLKKQFAYMNLPLHDVVKELPVKNETTALYNLLDDDQFEEMYQDFLDDLGEEE